MVVVGGGGGGCAGSGCGCVEVKGETGGGWICHILELLSASCTDSRVHGCHADVDLWSLSLHVKPFTVYSLYVCVCPCVFRSTGTK